MMLNQAYRFLRQDTLEKMLGEELAQSFDPICDYTFVPLSENLESDQNKMKKVGVYDQMNGRLAGLAKIFPKEIAGIIAYNTGRQAELMGTEYNEIKHMLDALTKAKPQDEGKGAESVKDGKAPPTSNQEGIEMSGTEEGARGM